METNKTKEFIIKRDCFGNIYTQTELVRCKDCRYSSMEERNLSPHWLPCKEMDTDYDWFCAYGERRTDG